MYTESDIKKILGRASEIQDRSEGLSLVYGSKGELSLKEIEEIAKEINVSPEYVRQAVAEFEGIPLEEPFFIDNDISHEIEILGFARGEPDQKALAELLSVIEQEFKCTGKVKRNRDTIRWEARPAGRFKNLRNSSILEIKKSGSQSSIRLRKNIRKSKAILYPSYIALAGAVVLFTVMLSEGAPEVIFFIAGFLGIAKIFQGWYKSKISKGKEQLKDTMATLQTIIARRQFSEQNINQIDLETGESALTDSKRDQTSDRIKNS